MSDKSSVHFLEILDQKEAMAAGLNCDAFLDDLPEVLTASDFPCDIYQIQFDPYREVHLSKLGNDAVISAWFQLPQLISAIAL